jgi:hypothetical protein
LKGRIRRRVYEIFIIPNSYDPENVVLRAVTLRSPLLIGLEIEAVA